jgi:ADP-heptose:LPS heptosyltransferase
MAAILTRIRNSAFARLVDRAAGSPLLWLVGALRPKRPVPAALRRVGIMMFETIGDTLLASALIGSLRANDPALQIVVFASRGNLGVLPLIDGIHAVVEVPLTRPLRALAAVRSAPVDVMVDIGQWPRWYAVLCALSRSRHTIGFATPGQWRHFAYDSPVAHRSDVHELENFQRLLSPLRGVTPLPPTRALKAVGEPPAPIAAKVPYVVVHPWASGFNFAAREWPLERWTALIRRVCATGRTVLITGGPADRARSAGLAASCSDLPVESIAGTASLPELAAIVRHAEAVVSVNTGVMHLAAILDVPLVALHGPTSRRRWGPIGSRSVALAPPSGARAEFLNLGFEYPGGVVDCMAAISVDEVFGALHTQVAAAAAHGQGASAR